MNYFKIKLPLALLFIFILIINGVNGQGISLKVEKTTITTNEYLNFNLSIKNGKFREKEDFPNIKGFIKRGKSSKEFTRILGTSIEKESMIIQHYRPEREGIYKIPPFAIKVNGQSVQFAGAKVNVIKSNQSRTKSKNPIDVFDWFYNQKKQNNYADVKPVTGGFLKVYADKKEIYVGEGVNLTITLFLEDNARSHGSEINLKKVVELAKKFTFPSCLEQKFDLNVNMFQKVKIKGKIYNKANLLQTTFYPYTDKDIDIPVYTLDLEKYEKTNTGFFSFTNRKPIKFSVRSRPLKIKVKQLPPHPLRDKVIVGEFRLKENINGTKFNTGNKINYFLSIIGTGNISLINQLTPMTEKGFDIYPPNISQDVVKQRGIVKGKSLFNFLMVGHEPGNYDLGEYFQWVYFNPRLKKYDTLRSKYKLTLTGERLKRKAKSKKKDKYEGFYTAISNASNKLMPLENSKKTSRSNYIYNLLAIISIGFVAFFIYRQKKSSSR